MGMFGLGLLLEDDDDEFKISAGNDKEDDTTVDPEADDEEDIDDTDTELDTDDTTTPEDDTDSSGDTEQPVDDEDNDDFTISAGDDDTDTEDNTDGEDTDNTDGEDTEDNTTASEDDTDGEEEDPSTKMYDSLSDQDKENKNVALKGNYRELYMNCDSIIEKLNDIPKEIENNDIIGNVISSLSDLKSYIEYYLANNFNNRTFIENDIMFNKYLSILNGIKNVIKDIQILIEL